MGKRKRKLRMTTVLLTATTLVGGAPALVANGKEISDPWATELTEQERKEWEAFLVDTSWQNNLNAHGTNGSASLISDPDGGTLQLGVTERPLLEDVTEQVTWSIDNEEVAVVSETGLVTAKKPGQVTVTAKAEIDGVEKQGKIEIEIQKADATYKDDFDNIVRNYEVPEWFQDAKFGIFIHWGVYAEPALSNEWLPREMYEDGNKVQEMLTEKYGEDFLTTKGYKDFVPLFKAEDYDPESWAKLFKEAGAKYVVPVAEHHDGIAMYDSDWTRWDMVTVGAKQDLIAPLEEAVRDQGMKFGLSSHYIENEFFYNFARGDESKDASNPDWFDLYNNANEITSTGAHSRGYTESHMQTWFNRSKDFIDKYNPDLVYYDFNLPGNHYTEQILSYYYNKAEETNPDGVVLNYKFNLPEGSAVYDIERGQATDILPMPWQTDSSISNRSWGYIDRDTYKPAVNLINLLIDVVSKNGNLLLNVGPDSAGNIPEDAAKTFEDMGKWLDTNGEGIYATRPWITYGEGPTIVNSGTFAETNKFTSKDIRFTVSKDRKNIYAIGMRWPESGTMEVKLMNQANFDLSGLSEISLLGSDEEITYVQDETSMKIDLRKTNPNGGENPYIVKLTFGEQSVVEKESLKTAYETYEGVSEEGYTNSSLTELSEAYDNARNVIDNAAATQSQVDEAEMRLKKAFDGLTTKLAKPAGEHRFLRPDDFKGNLGTWTIEKDEESYDGTTLCGVKNSYGTDLTEDAAAVITVKEAGTYDIWVHAKEMDEKNKDEEAWSFKLGVNDEVLETVFGGQQKPKRGYLWKYGGKVTLEKGENKVYLKDISGNYARCDALFLSNNEEVFPDDYTFDEMEVLQTLEGIWNVELAALEHQIKYAKLIRLEEYQELPANTIFTETLATAGEILAHVADGESTSQEEIDKMAMGLQKARTNLRLSPSKERLEDYLNSLK